MGAPRDQKTHEDREDKQKTPDLDNQEKSELQTFLNEIYQEEPVYFDEKHLDQKEKGKDVLEKDYEKKITRQVDILINYLKIAYNKNDIYEKVEKELKITLDPDQKQSIYNKKFDEKDSVQKAFNEAVKKILKDDEWNEISGIYFSCQTSQSLISYLEKSSLNSQRTQDRKCALKRGKELLEDIVFKITRPDSNTSIVESALKNLHTKIKTKPCVQGFINELTSMQAELDVDPRSMAYRVLTNLAIEHINELKNNPEDKNNLNAIIYQGFETHVAAELVYSFAEEHKDYEILTPTKKEEKDYFAKDFLNKAQYSYIKKDFIKKCLKPGIIANNIIDIWVEQHMLFLTAVLPEEKNEKKEEKSFENSVLREKFMDSLDALGKISESSIPYFDKKSTEATKRALLRESIYKRVMISGYIPDAILPRKIITQKTNDDSYRVITTCVPYISNAPETFQSALDEAIHDAKLEPSVRWFYVLVDHDRQYDFLMLSEAPTSENIQTLHQKMTKNFAYGFLATEKKTERVTIGNYELYFLQKNPASFRKIQSTIHKKTLESQITEYLKQEPPYRINKSLTSITKQYDLEEHIKRQILVVQKEPWKVLRIRNEDIEEQYQRILKNLEISDNPFEETRVINKSNAASIVTAECQYSPSDRFYINPHSLRYSYVAPHVLSNEDETLITLFDYLKKSKTIDSKKHSENQEILDTLRSLNIERKVFISCMKYLTDNDIRYLLRDNESEYYFFNGAYANNKFNLMDRFISLLPEASFFREIKDSREFFGDVLDTLLTEKPKKIEEFFEFGRKYNLIGDVNGGNVKHIFKAAEKGLIDTLEVLIKLYNPSFVSDGSSAKEEIMSYLKGKYSWTPDQIMVGVCNLIIKKDFVQAGRLLQYYSDKELKSMDPNPRLTVTIIDAIIKNNVVTLKTILTALPKHFVKLNDLKPIPLQIAAEKGNFPIIELLQQHGATCDDDVLINHLQTGLKTLIQEYRYQDAEQSLKKYSLIINKEIQKLLINNLCIHANSSSSDELGRLKNLLDFLRNVNQLSLINEFDHHGNPPINYAANFSNLKGIDLLIEKGALIDFKPSNQNVYGFYTNIIMGFGNLIDNKNMDKASEIFAKYPDINLSEEKIFDTHPAKKAVVYYQLYSMLKNDQYTNEIFSLLNIVFKQQSLPDFTPLFKEKLLEYVTKGKTAISHYFQLKPIIKSYLTPKELENVVEPALHKALELKNFHTSIYLIKLFVNSEQAIQSLIAPQIIEHCKYLVKNNDHKALQEIFTKNPDWLMIPDAQGDMGLYHTIEILITFPEWQRSNLLDEWLNETLKEYKNCNYNTIAKILNITKTSLNHDLTTKLDIHFFRHFRDRDYNKALELLTAFPHYTPPPKDLAQLESWANIEKILDSSSLETKFLPSENNEQKLMNALIARKIDNEEFRRTIFDRALDEDKVAIIPKILRNTKILDERSWCYAVNEFGTRILVNQLIDDNNWDAIYKISEFKCYYYNNIVSTFFDNNNANHLLKKALEAKSTGQVDPYIVNWFFEQMIRKTICNPADLSLFGALESFIDYFDGLPTKDIDDIKNINNILACYPIDLLIKDYEEAHQHEHTARLLQLLRVIAPSSSSDNMVFKDEIRIILAKGRMKNQLLRLAECVLGALVGFVVGLFIPVPGGCALGIVGGAVLSPLIASTIRKCKKKWQEYRINNFHFDVPYKLYGYKQVSCSGGLKEPEYRKRRKLQDKSSSQSIISKFKTKGEVDANAAENEMKKNYNPPNEKEYKEIKPYDPSYQIFSPVKERDENEEKIAQNNNGILIQDGLVTLGPGFT